MGVGVAGGNNVNVGVGDGNGLDVGVNAGVGSRVRVAVGTGGDCVMVSNLASTQPVAAEVLICTHSPWRARTLTPVPWGRRAISDDSISGDCRMMISRT